MWHRTGPRYTCMLTLALAVGAACGDDDIVERSDSWVAVAGRAGDEAGRDRDQPVRAGRSARDAGRAAGSVAGVGPNEAGGSAGASGAPEDGPAAGAAADAGSVDVADLTEAEIASITLTFHAGEFERAMVAEGSAQRSAVASFARRMVLASSASEQREDALYRMLSIEAADNPISMQLRTSSTRLLEQLLASPPPEFDALYLAGLETVHENALSLIARMQNSASRPELASELGLMRADVIAHLTEARQIQSMLPIDGGSDTADDAGAEEDAGE